ncbi:sentrin-specific protease 6 isoform X4 [Xiphias gladius]|nr:sentrin-specific protease 6 isoform X4 [Xiphias gladius]XP_039981157.1 sentrin-specific protease 6 isoform X4 [Xiphias gladius]XP_039981158.1 sentrin-specific protease 6 isoform X4 [Xiphias gladius]XP_039981159.1 sentrin-specific protease 6 isoform X4 [Xiphias gladius]
MEEMDRQQPTSPEEKKSPTLRHFTSSDPLRTYENRPNNHMRPLNRLGPKKLSEVPLSVATSSPMPNRTNYFIISPAPPQGIVLQGRHFQHAQMPSAIRKPVQRNDFSTTQQAVEVDSIVLTCPEIPEEEALNIKRRVQQKRKPLEGCCSFPSQVKATEPLRPTIYQSVCVKCNKPSEDSGECQNCGNSPTLLPCQQATLSSPTPRPPIRSQPSPGPNSLPQNFYKPATTMRAPRGETVPIRITSTRGTLLPLNNGRSPLLAGTSSCCRARNPPKGKRTTAAQQHELNDPIVLSSDDEEEADNASTGSVSRLDSVSPRPADSAHSSPAPSGGRVEAAVKSAGDQEEMNTEFFEDVNMKITIPRRARMKDQFGNQPPEQFSPRTKKPKIMSNKCDSIILECRSVRVGTLRRMVTKPVVFSIDHIQLETEGPERDSIEKVCLQASELISCEWCSVRKLPVLFFQTSPEECNRLRSQLNMSKEKGGQWYDCAGDQSDEKYIVLIFENGLAMKEQMILEDILGEIGRTNSLSNFPAKLPFEEANIRLVNYNKATKQKEEKAKPIQSPPKMSQGSPAGKVPHATQVAPVTPVTMPVRTRMATRQQTSAYFEDEDEDMTDLQPTFSGPIVKLMVYPPPPAKGGISVTNEDLHCLNDGEFLNDVIIDFYLKYLVLEKLKKEDAQRIHVFSSFFYKRLNQRERRNVPDTANLPIQKRKHNRVKTWTRHVDLFQKDFIFVPINESAHWYLAVICFPGLEGPVYEQNPLYHGPLPASALAADPTSEENIPDHCRPLSPDRDGLDSSSEQPSPAVPEASGDGQPDADAAKENSAFADGGQEPSGTPTTSSNGQADAERQYTSELHRISVCYSSRKGDDDTYTFSDDQSSCQVLGSLCPLICLLVTLMDECSEDGTLAEDTLSSDASGLASKPNLCKQPCILIMDSLRGPARSTVVKTLREYLEVEWEVRKGTQRSFGKDVMRGSSPRVPQQDNFSDCGVYILQYVESFFENPIPTFHLPVNLSEWFPQQRMKTKREEIKELILKIQAQQELDREEPDQAEAPPGSPEDPEIEETSGSAGPPPNLPISP